MQVQVWEARSVGNRVNGGSTTRLLDARISGGSRRRKAEHLASDLRRDGGQFGSVLFA